MINTTLNLKEVFNMRKTLTFTLLLLTLFVLVACGSKTSGNILKSELLGNTYTYVLNIDENITKDNDLLSAAYSASSHIYESIQDEIGLGKYYLDLTIQIKGTNKVQLKFVINENITKPGLKLISEKIL